MAKKNDKKKETANLKGLKSISTRLSIIIAGMNLIILLAIGLVIFFSMTSSVKEDSIKGLENITKTIETNVEMKVADEKSAMLKLADYEGLNSMDFKKQAKILKPKVEKYGYLDMAICDLKGQAHYVASDKTLDLSDRNYVKKALGGETVISDVLISRLSGDVVFMYATPLKKDDKVIGALIGTRDALALSDLVADIKPSENGYVYVINDEGRVVGHPDKELVKNQFNPILESKTNPELVTLGKAYEEIVAKKKGTSQYKFRGKHQNVAFDPVDGTNWYVIAASPDSDVLAGVNRITIILIIIFLVAIIVSITIAIIVGKRIAAPLRYITSGLTKIANYNLDTQVERKKLAKYINTRDEIGEMTRAIRMMVANLTEMVKNIGNHASSTAATAEELTATAQSTNESAKEVASAVTNIADGASGQAQDTSDAAHNVEANSKSLQEMISVLEKLANAVQNIDAKKDEGKLALNGLTKLSEENKEEAVHINQIIIETNESAEAISKASEMIQSIADQTNLLALNAAIDKGFAVVAEEIRKLAEDSTKFTEEIRVIIEGLKEKAGTAVSRMQNAARIVEESDKQTRTTQEKFDEIEEAVSISKDIVKQVNESSKTIEENNNRIVAIIENLSAIAEENAATSQEANANVETQTNSINDISNASDNLSELASELQNEVANFKL